MSSENNKINNPPTASNMVEPPLIPPVNVTPPRNGDPDLNRWAEERVAIYASLDAQMTRYLVEAISALSELKQQAEEQAFETNQSIIQERDRLRRETEEMRLEQLQLRDEIEESRRQYEEAEARRIALEHSSAAWLEQARAERDELQLEIRRLRVQLEEVRHDLNDFYNRRSEAVEASGGFAAWLEKKAQMEADRYAEPMIPPPPPELLAPAQALELGDLPIFSLENLSPAEPALQDFDDAPTPRIPGGSPVIILPGETSLEAAEPVPFEVESIPVAVEPPVEESQAAEEAEAAPSLFDLGATPITGEEFDIEQDHAEVLRLFNELEGPTAEEEAAVEAALLKLMPPEKTRDRNRRTRTERRVNHLLGKRKEGEADEVVTPEGVEPPTQAAPVEEVPAFLEKANEKANQPAPVQTTSRLREKASREEKEVLREIGSQLGLEAMTPPPMSALRFAPGFTPPAEPTHLREVVNELKANAEALATSTHTSTNGNGKSSKTPLVRPIKPPARKSLPIPPVTPEISEDEGPQTIEELLAAGEQDLAAINENPTPPEDPAPLIGNLSDDALEFHTESITPGQTRQDKLEETPPSPAPPVVPETAVSEPIIPFTPAEAEKPAPQPNLRARGTGALDQKKLPPEKPAEPNRPATNPPTPPVRRSRKTTNSLGILPLPVPPSLPSQQDVGETAVTKLTVSNLQGRYSPLLMEKVVRNLEDVTHVIVTDFSKGVLGMDVRHKRDFDLADKLLSMPELHLQLLSQEPGSLELSQESPT